MGQLFLTVASEMANQHGGLVPAAGSDNGDGTATLVTSGGGGGGGSSTPTGTAGSPNAAVLSVQGVTNGTVLPIVVDGTAATGVAQTTGGTGAIGWLSGILNSLRTIATAITGTQAVSIAAAVAIAPIGTGALTAVPAAAANGTAIGTLPSTSSGVAIYVPPNGSITFTIATSAPSSAPANTLTYANNGTNPLEVDVNLAGGANVYVTATVGSNLFRVL